MGTVRRPKGLARVFLPYWLGALAFAYAIHVDLVPVRHWLAAMTPAASPEAPGAPPTEVPGRAPPPPTEPAPAALPLADLEADEGSEVPAEPEDAPVSGDGASEGGASEDGVSRAGDGAGDEAGDGVAVAAEPSSEREDVDTSSDQDLSHLWAVEDPVLTQPAPRRDESDEDDRRVASRSEPAPAVGPAPEPTSRRRREVRKNGGSSGGKSCEAAIAAYRERVKMGDDSLPPDISAARYGAVLNRGSYFSHCGLPDSTAVHICAAVQNGRAVGVTVTTTPRSGKLERCVASAVRGLGFPSHPRMDVTRTTFE